MMDCNLCGEQHCPICGSHMQAKRDGCERGQYLFCLCSRLIEDLDKEL